MFEWDEDKRQANIRKHGLDFIRVKEIWNGPVLEIPSDQFDHGEIRILAIGSFQQLTITVVYAWRGENRRLISARKARRYEQEIYKDEIR